MSFHEPRRARRSASSLALVLLASVAPAVAGAEEVAEAPTPYRNPQGSLLVGGGLGVGFGGGSTVVAVSVGAGYAVLTGVVPGLRGTVISDSKAGVGGEVAATLTLTPPLSFYLVPFITGEVGRRFEPFDDGWTYGVGGGLFLGEPDSHFGLQVGWVFRRIAYDKSGDLDASGPLIALSLRF